MLDRIKSQQLSHDTHTYSENSFVVKQKLVKHLHSWVFRGHTNVARGCRGAGAPPRPQGDEKIYLGIFCLNEAKIGLNLLRCTPADEIKR